VTLQNADNVNIKHASTVLCNVTHYLSMCVSEVLKCFQHEYKLVSQYRNLGKKLTENRIMKWTYCHYSYNLCVPAFGQIW